MIKIKKYECPDPPDGKSRPDAKSRYAQIIRTAQMKDCERGKISIIVAKLKAKAKKQTSGR